MIVELSLKDPVVLAALAKVLFDRVSPDIERYGQEGDPVFYLTGAEPGQLERMLCYELHTAFGEGNACKLKGIAWEERPPEYRNKCRLQTAKLEKGYLNDEIIATFQVGDNSFHCMTNQANIAYDALVVHLVVQQNDKAMVDLPGDVYPATVGNRMIVPSSMLLPFF